MASYRVLVVDDNSEIRRMVTSSIKTLGAEVDVLDVPSAEEALVISASLSIDLVVLDIRLPGMTGLEMVDRLRRRRPEIKIILVTGAEDEQTRKLVAGAGVAAYFFKPIEIANFLDAVRRCLWSGEEKTPYTSGVAGARPLTGVSGISTPRQAPAVKARGKSAAPRFQPTPDERLNALKQQLKAVTVLLVNEVGQVVETAGDPSQITSGYALLPALMDAFRASQKVSDAFGKEATESLLCFVNARQRIYLAVVDECNLLLVILSGFFEPDKLGMIGRAIQTAASDLRLILKNIQDADSMQVDASPEQGELPAEVVVDQETLAGVADMFSRASKGRSENEADGFWDSLPDSDLDGAGGKDVLSYDQARGMGLAPEEDR